MVFLCLSIATYTIDNQRQEAKAIAPAIPALAVGAIVLGAGVYFYNKEDLQNFTRDCMDWLEDSVPDAFKELSNLVANGSKIIVSSILQKGVMSYLKTKGWGSEEPLTNIEVNSSASALFCSLYPQIKKLPDGYVHLEKINDFFNLFSTGNYNIVCQISENGRYIFSLIENDVTDLYGYSRSTGPGSPLYGVRENGEVVNINSEYIGNVSRFVDMEMLDDNSGLWYAYARRGSGGYGYLITNLIGNDTIFGTTFENTFFPSGINAWRDESSYLTGNKDFILHITGTNYVSVPVDIGSNANLQTEDTAISVPTIGNMTLEQFIEATGDLAQDDTPAWEQVLEQLGALTGGGENEGDNDDDNENNGAVGGDFIIPGLGLTWFESLLESVKSIPKSITDKISDTVLKFQFAYEDFKDWLADLIKSIPKSFKSLFTTVTDAITDIPGSISGYFTDVVEAVQAIDIPAFPSLDDIKNGLLAIPGYIQALPSQFRDWFEQIIAGIQVIPIIISGYFADVVEAIEAIDFPAFPSLEAITEGVLAIPGQFADWFESVIAGIQALPGEFTSLIDRIIEAIQALPGAFSKWLDWSGIIEAINAIADILGNIFIIDGAMIHAAYLDLADAVSTHWNIFEQMKKLCDVAVTESKIEYPVIYMQVPSFLKPVLQNNKNYVKGTHQAYNSEKGMLVMDLSNYQELFKWCRRISGGFIWFLLFRWIMRKFDIQIILSS